jgi:hypothetical protein
MIPDICVQPRGSNMIMMSDFIPMAFESFERISVGLRAHTGIMAPMIVPDMIVRVVAGPMDIDQEISK